MSKYRIGALTISQSPRFDLIEPLRITCPHCEIIEAGALDFVDVTALPDGHNAYYPLTTTLTDGTTVTLNRDFLSPPLQRALNHLEAQGVDISLLLCAGDFPDLVAEKLLVKPTDIAMRTLQAMGFEDVGVVSPIAIQNQPIKSKWLQAGFHAVVWTMPPKLSPEHQAHWIKTQCDLHPQVDCIVLDYVGYPTASIHTIQRMLDLPVFDLGHLAIANLSAIIS